MEFKIGDRVIYINKIYKDEIGTVVDTDLDENYNIRIKFDNTDINVTPIFIGNLRKLTKLEKALA